MAGNRRQMDERQLWLQGSIYKHMFILTAVLLLLNAFVQDYHGSWAPGRYESVLILFMVVAAGSIEMIVKDAYLIPGSGRRIYIALMAVAGLLLLVLNVIHTVQDGWNFWAAGRLTERGSGLLLAVLFLSIPVTFLIYWFATRRGERQEDA